MRAMGESGTDGILTKVDSESTLSYPSSSTKIIVGLGKGMSTLFQKFYTSSTQFDLSLIKTHFQTDEEEKG